MKHFTHPETGFPYLALRAAQCLEQMHDRLQSNANFVRSSTADGDKDPPVELSVDEALLMAKNANRLAALLRKLGEGRI